MVFVYFGGGGGGREFLNIKSASGRKAGAELELSWSEREKKKNKKNIRRRRKKTENETVIFLLGESPPRSKGAVELCGVLQSC